MCVHEQAHAAESGNSQSRLVPRHSPNCSGPRTAFASFLLPFFVHSSTKYFGTLPIYIIKPHVFVPPLAATGSPDLIVTAGGGIVAHPGGVAAGVAAMRQAYEAAQSGVDAQIFAKNHPALAAALEAF